LNVLPLEVGGPLEITLPSLMLYLKKRSELAFRKKEEVASMIEEESFYEAQFSGFFSFL
jgi:hypothetical protein